MTVGQHMWAGRQAAFALFRASFSKNQVEARNAAQCLLEMALQATSLVEDSALLNRDTFRNVCAHYPFFPILLASNRGRDTKQKLNRIASLPIGGNWPFKRLSGKARNDSLRRIIESAYDKFQHIRLRRSPHIQYVGPVGAVLEKDIRKLPNLSKPYARQWAAMIARYYLASPGGGKLLDILGINSLSEATKKTRRKETRLSKKYGGGQLTIEEGNKRKKGKEGARYFIHSGNIGEGREVDFLEASRFDKKRSDAQRTTPTDADKTEAFVDAIEKRLRSILK